MGMALAQAFGVAGHKVTVWNRSPNRYKALTGQNIEPVPDLAAAVSASDVLVLCVDNPNSVRDLLDASGIAEQLRGRVVIQLSTCLPRQAIEAEAWLDAQGAACLDGAVLCGPAMIGTADGKILLCGRRSAHESTNEMLACLGGKVEYLGENIAAASSLDLAWLATRFGQFMGMVHAANLCRSQGVDLASFMALFPGDTQIQHHVGTIRDNSYENPSATLEVWRASLELVRRQASDAGINREFPDLVARFFDRAVDAGYGGDHVMSLFKVMRDHPGDAGCK